MNWILAVLSGLLLAASFPPLGLWPLAWVALAPLWVAVRRAPDARTAADLGGLCGLVFYTLALPWLVKVFGPFAAGFWCLLALGMALHAAMLRTLRETMDGWSPRLSAVLWTVVAAATYTGIEYFRAEVWGLACPWLSLGFSQANCPPLLQAAGLFGVYGLSFLIAASNAAWAEGWPGGSSMPGVALLALVLALAGWGGLRLKGRGADQGRPVTVALVQDERFDLDRLARMSLSREARNADLLVWPEYGFTVQPGQEDRYARLVAERLSGSGAVAVVAGAILPEKGVRMRNFAWVLAPGGRLLGRYDKAHPIPYVEKDLAPNPGPRPVDSPLGPLGVQICYDLDFEDGARRMVRLGARILAVPNLDPWDWGAGQHRQHSAMAPLRAVESGLWVVRAASSGASQIIDPLGRVRAALPPGLEGVLVGRAYIKEGGTPYTAWGWLVGPLCLGASCLGAAAFALARRGLPLWRSARGGAILGG